MVSTGDPSCILRGCVQGWTAQEVPVRWLQLLAIAAACTPQTAGELEDCARIDAATARDECYAELLFERLAANPEEVAERVEELIEDPLVRDFVYLRAARELEPASGRWCEHIHTGSVAERCRLLASRPHLHRALAPGQAPQGEAAEPPAGPLPGSGAAPNP